LEETEETSEGNQNELIFCEGAHAHARTGCYHPLCVNPALQAQPKGEWLCPECVASGLRVMEDVVGKRKPGGPNKTGRVQYQIKWQGEAGLTWEFRSNAQRNGKACLGMESKAQTTSECATFPTAIDAWRWRVQDRHSNAPVLDALVSSPPHPHPHHHPHQFL
jgi:hypothetical protein